jgi:hypothetical protein
MAEKNIAAGRNETNVIIISTLNVTDFLHITLLELKDLPSTSQSPVLPILKPVEIGRNKGLKADPLQAITCRPPHALPTVKLQHLMQLDALNTLSISFRCAGCFIGISRSQQSTPMLLLLLFDHL